MNEAYRDAVLAFDWSTKFGDDVIQTSTPESSSTLLAGTAGDATVEAAAAVWNTAWTNRKIQIGTNIYDVTSFASTTVANLADTLVADHDSGTEYVVYQDEFSMPNDCEQLLVLFTGNTSYRPLEKVPIDTMLYWKSTDQIEGNDASAWADAGTDSSGYRKIMIHRVPAIAVNLRARYMRALTEMTGDSDVPTLLPFGAHRLIGLKASVYAYQYDREPRLAEQAEGQYQLALAQAMTRESVASSRMRLEPGIFAGGTDDWADAVRYGRF